MENRIKSARIADGLTQSEMSKRFEIPLDTIKKWDSGAYKPPEWAAKLLLEKLQEVKNMIKVTFDGGQGRNTDKAVNYMIADVDGVELYAEVEIPDDADPDEYGYDELKKEIISQAKEHDIDVNQLKFWWD